MFPEENNATNSNPPLKPIQSDQYIKNVIGLAYNLPQKRIYYSDIQQNTINQVDFDGKNHRVLFEGVGSIEGMAYDGNHDTLYWTSSTKHAISKIEIYKVQNSTQKYTIYKMLPKYKEEIVLLLRPTDKPRGIDVDPCEKKIYFTNWNMEAPSIQRCSYNGYGVESIITTDIR